MPLVHSSSSFKENEMSDHTPNHLGPLQASLRNHLGQFADLWMQSKIALVRKLSERIAAAHDVEELRQLRIELNDAVLNEEDINSFGERLDQLIEVGKKFTQGILAIQKMKDDYRSESHGDHGHHR